MADNYKIAELANILDSVIAYTHNAKKSGIPEREAKNLYEPLKLFFTASDKKFLAQYKESNDQLAADYNKLKDKNTKLVNRYAKLEDDHERLKREKLEQSQQLEQALEANEKLYKDLIRKDEQVGRLIDALTGILKVNASNTNS